VSRAGKILLAIVAIWAFLVLLYYLAFGFSGG
jgi:hypothetical protein